MLSLERNSVASLAMLDKMLDRRLTVATNYEDVNNDFVS